MELKRTELNKIVENFYDKRASSSESEIVNLFLETLNNLEEQLINCEYNDDSRFVTFSRRDFLNKEMYTSLKQENYEQAFYDIIDYVKADTWISMGDVPLEYNFHDIVKMDDEYKNSGIICKQEQEILLQMIKDFKDLVEKNKNNKFTYNEGDLIIADTQCDLCRYNNKDNVNVCSKFENGKPEEILNDNTLCPFLKNKGKDPFIVDDLVQKIKDMEIGTETTIAYLLGDLISDYTTKELFEITNEVIEICKSENIILDYSKYKNMDVGLPFNIPFIKR